MTRIVGGRFGGARLSAPSGAGTRPTSEKVRAALGNALEAAGAVSGARVLDLYAGSAALGLELLSRGAGALVAVERDRAAVQVARRNVTQLGLDSVVTVVTADVAGWVRTPVTGIPADLLVADPPYDLSDADLRRVLADAAVHGHLAAGADVVLERRFRPVRGGARDPDDASTGPWPEGYTAVRAKRYGDTELCYGRAP